MSKRKQKSRLVENRERFCCPRCNSLTERFEHKQVTEKQLRQPFYYSQWFRCSNPQCQTIQIMRDQDRVWTSARWKQRKQAPEEAAPFAWQRLDDVVMRVLGEVSEGEQNSAPPWEA